jgi:hypothetical protein
MPYAQGELDGLCGVYAIVNAVENTGTPAGPGPSRHHRTVGLTRTLVICTQHDGAYRTFIGFRMGSDSANLSCKLHYRSNKGAEKS